MKIIFRLATLIILVLLYAFFLNGTALCEADSAQVTKTNLFSVAFPKEGWARDVTWMQDSLTNSSVRYILRGENKTRLAEFMIEAHIGAALDHRSMIMRFDEITNKTALDETPIGGVLFSYIKYEYGSAHHMEYAARVPECSMNLRITIYEASDIKYDYQPILDSISFTLSMPASPNKDPPRPEDSEPFQPRPGKAYIGGREIAASWLPMDVPILVSEFTVGNIALHNDTLYILTGRRIYAKQIKGGSLEADPVFPEGILKLDDDYDLMSMTGDGTLFVTNTVLKNFSVRDGTVNQTNQSGIGSLAVHPSGKWGISFSGQGNPEIIHITQSGYTSQNWALHSPRDPKSSTGRFGHIQCLTVYEDRVYVSDIDTAQDNITVVSAFDLDGNELFTFGSGNLTDPDGLSFVTNISQTQKSIIILDVNLDSLKVLSRDGKLIGSVNCDELLGTKHANVFSIAPADDGLMIAAAQSREDGSCTELMIFRVTGL